MDIKKFNGKENLNVNHNEKNHIAIVVQQYML